MSKKKYAILLTACINPGNMIYTSVINKDIREFQYLDALGFYLKKTDLPIVFVENTGNDISKLFEKYVNTGRLEYLTFEGNDFDKNKGKGYGEAGILEYALIHSIFLQKTDFIVKITGRLKVLNIMDLYFFHKRFLPWCDVQCGLNIETSFADSRLFITTLNFLQNVFLKKKELINDSEGIYFENILFDSIDEQSDFVFYPFFLRPMISGISGTSGQPYWEGNYFKVKLFHLQNMLDCSLRFNLKHSGNTSFITFMILKAISNGVNLCIFLLNNVTKGKP